MQGVPSKHFFFPHSRASAQQGWAVKERKKKLPHDPCLGMITGSTDVYYMEACDVTLTEIFFSSLKLF